MSKLNLTEPLESILEDLVSIPSVTGNENQIGKAVEESINSLGFGQDFSLWRREGNIVADVDSSRDEVVALVGHLDTVPPSRENQTVPYRERGSVYGLGAVDMKAGLACMLKMLYEISHNKFTPSKDLRFIFYTGEEGPLPNGLTHLLDKSELRGVDFAFVLEPTEGRYEVGCLGSISAEATVLGRSAHSASPHLGKNAVYLAQSLVQRVKNFKDRKVKVGDYTVNETMNVTTMNTSNARNMIPAQVVVNINYRFAPGVSLQDAQKIVQDVVRPSEDVSLHFADLSPSCIVSGNIDKYLLPNVKRGVMQAWTDIAQLNNAGVPAVNYGPGSITVAHSKDERISIKELNSYYNSLKKSLL